MRSWKEKLILTIFLIVVLGIVKVHLHFIKLLLLLALGVLGLWLLHRLAQDWNRITSSSSNRFAINPLAARPILSNLMGMASSGFRISKRSVSNTDSATLIKHQTNRAITMEPDRFNYLRNILRYDQYGCARKFVCYLASENSKKYSPSEDNVIRFVRSLSSSLPIGDSKNNFSDPLKLSMEFGLKYRNATACSEIFKRCPYTNIQLHKFYVDL